MPPDEPAPTAPFTDEDREFLEKQIVAYRANTFADCFSGEDAEALARVLAHIDHLEGALREIADDSNHDHVCKFPRLARAALRTSGDGDAG